MRREAWAHAHRIARLQRRSTFTHDGTVLYIAQMSSCSYLADGEHVHVHRVAAESSLLRAQRSSCYVYVQK